MGTSALTFIGLHRYIGATPSTRTIQPFGPLRKDPQRILDLPEGFTYRVLSKAGETMTDGLKLPGKPDGMTTFPGAGR